MLSPTPSSQLCPCAMATLDSCSNCARGLTFPLSPVQNKQKGFDWDQQHTKLWKVMMSDRKVDIPPAFHIYFTLGMIVVTMFLQMMFQGCWASSASGPSSCWGSTSLRPTGAGQTLPISGSGCLEPGEIGSFMEDLKEVLIPPTVYSPSLKRIPRYDDARYW